MDTNLDKGKELMLMTIKVSTKKAYAGYFHHFSMFVQEFFPDYFNNHSKEVKFNEIFDKNEVFVSFFGSIIEKHSKDETSSSSNKHENNENGKKENQLKAYEYVSSHSSAIKYYFRVINKVLIIKNLLIKLLKHIIFINQLFYRLNSPKEYLMILVIYWLVIKEELQRLSLVVKCRLLRVNNLLILMHMRCFPTSLLLENHQFSLSRNQIIRKLKYHSLIWRHFLGHL